MSRRTVMLVVSILVAAIGVGLVGLYVRGADARASGNAGLIPVLVVQRPVEAGAAVTADDFGTVLVPRGAVPVGALGVDGATRLSGRHAITNLTVGQFAVEAGFAKRGQSVQDAITPAPGDLLYGLVMNQQQRLAAVVQVGSTVIVEHPDSKGKTAVLASNVKVRTIGPTVGISGAVATPAPGTQGLEADLVTIEGPTDQINAIAGAQAAGDQLWFVVGTLPK